MYHVVAKPCLLLQEFYFLHLFKGALIIYVVGLWRVPIFYFFGAAPLLKPNMFFSDIPQKPPPRAQQMIPQ